jgi:hypothetical protein
MHLNAGISRNISPECRVLGLGKLGKEASRGFLGNSSASANCPKREVVAPNHSMGISVKAEHYLCGVDPTMTQSCIRTQVILAGFAASRLRGFVVLSLRFLSNNRASQFGWLRGQTISTFDG